MKKDEIEWKKNSSSIYAAKKKCCACKNAGKFISLAENFKLIIYVEILLNRNCFFKSTSSPSGWWNPPRVKTLNIINETERKKKNISWLHQMHDVNFSLFPLLSIMLIDETTCVSHTLLANWNKIASMLFCSQSYCLALLFFSFSTSQLDFQANLFSVIGIE